MRNHPTIIHTCRLISPLYIALLLFLGGAMWTSNASADALMLLSEPIGNCSIDPQFKPSDGPGVITSLIDNMTEILGINLYDGDTAQSGGLFGNTLSGTADFAEAALLLYVIIYGAFFMLGLIQASVHDFLRRMIKIGIIAVLLSPDSWNFFNTTVIQFFLGGMNDIINEMLYLPFNMAFQPGDTPFWILDSAVAQIFSAKMAVTMLAIFFTGPYGIVMGIIILIACWLFIKSLLSAMWVYLMSLVLLTLLFGLAPIFIICMLFERTKQLFIGWRSQLLNAALQPTLMFIFFAFFVNLIGNCVSDILNNPVCWTETLQSLRGTPFYAHFWRFAMPGGSGWDLFPGTWEMDGVHALTPGNTANYPLNGVPPFPISIVTILMFLILAELANRFNNVVTMIARDLADSTIDLSYVQGAFTDWLTDGKRGGGSGSGGGGGSLDEQNKFFNNSGQSGASLQGNRNKIGSP